MKRYIVTFEERMRVDGEVRWVESARVFEDIESAKSFLETMYSFGDSGLRYLTVWCGEKIPYEVKVEVKFDKH